MTGPASSGRPRPDASGSRPAERTCRTPRMAVRRDRRAPPYPRLHRVLPSACAAARSCPMSIGLFLCSPPFPGCAQVSIDTWIADMDLRLGRILRAEIRAVGARSHRAHGGFGGLECLATALADLGHGVEEALARLQVGE